MIICLFAFPLYVYAGGCAEKNNVVNNNDSSTESNAGAEEEAGEKNEEADGEKSSKKQKEEIEPFRIKERGFEIGISASAGFANNLLSADDIFRETVEIDLDNLADDFRLNFGMGIAPFYIKYSNKRFGYGLSTNIDFTGIFSLSKELIAFSAAKDKKSELSGAVYADAGIDLFLNIFNFKINFRPAAFYPLAVLKSDVSYTYDNTGKTLIDIGVDARLYTAVPMEDLSSNFVPTGAPGFDFSISAEFPLTRAIGLQEKIPFLDIDLGLGMANIPITKAKIKDYMGIKGNLTISGDNLDELMDSFDGISDNFSDRVYGQDEITVYRPFKLMGWINFHPINKTWRITLTPSFGFSINPVYAEPFSYEGGLKLRIDLANIFIVTAGARYEDRLWINSLDLAINVRLVELNVGVDLRSREFMKNTNAQGIGAKVGIKLGW
jgi:hypothetical protein